MNWKRGIKLKDIGHITLWISFLLFFTTIFFIGPLLSNPVIKGADTVLLKLNSPSENISSKIEYRYRGFQFRHCKVETIETLSRMEWHHNGSEVVRVKRNPTGNWLRFRLANTGEEPIFRTLVLGWLNVPDAELCSLDSNGKFEAGFAGYDIDPLWNDLISPPPHFNIRLQPQEERTFYLYVLSNEDINYPVRLLPEKDYMVVVRLRSVIFVTMGFVLLLSLGYNGFHFFKTRKPLFLALPFHLFSLAATLYFLHGKEFASIVGNENNLFRHNYFLFLGITHIAFFLYLAAWDMEDNGNVYRSPLFWIVCLTGILYPLIPLYQFWYDHRILILVANYGLMILYFGKTHISLVRPRSVYDLFFISVWGIFLLLDLYKTIFHFDFYPYNRIAVFGVLYFIPFLTAFVSLLSREIIRRREEGEGSARKSHLASLDINHFVQRIRQLLESEKIFLTKSLKEEHVARELGITIHQLSELINTEFKTSFPSLINQYRVEEAKNLLMELPEENTTEIGSRAGFSSRSAFYLEFKKLTGTNPNSFRKDMLADKVQAG
ncbi:DNA-binding helix-turn-helix protein [Leptospira broomii serovar Hurstbridge str. 5399]|uniref:DNA-binding helix-turn-helix protein n=1 Tax=Leptospira broomii serovar Hurstbridge str. 5399 TaxID=1049789 RepID=T0EWZ7_9LEPT|nr:helix-turn-helix domain-containing protein [Leptospira broomii]EQA43415.1 DNA-binding helix-turn-helix protein [Leptospira broomii serovar Hurstbridge str. 5399]